MRSFVKKNGFTLVELLTVMAILVLLAGALLTTTDYIRTQSQAKLTASTIEVMIKALEQYYEDEIRGIGGSFPVTAGDTSQLIWFLEDDLGFIHGDGDVVIVGNNVPDYASIEWMFYLLEKSINSSNILSAISGQFITNMDSSGNEIIVEWPLGGGIRKKGLIRIVDVWGNAFRYTFAIGDAFPVIVSAGKDGDFSTAGDNISSEDL